MGFETADRVRFGLLRRVCRRFSTGTVCYVRHLIAGIASLGGLLFGYETGLTAGALERSESSWLSTATLIGAMLGALAAGRIADMVGRRDVITATAALFTLGAFVTAIAPSELVLLIGELVVGIGVGAISVAAPLDIADLACRQPRLADLHLPVEDHGRNPARLHWACGF